MTLKSLTYYLLIAAVIVFYGTQMGSFKGLSKPVEGKEETYGVKPSEDKKEIMESTLAMLANDYDTNEYIVYPVGFYKRVTLNEEKQEKVHQILKECTGMEDGYADAVQFVKLPETESDLLKMMTGIAQSHLAVEPSLTYERFLELMEQVDELVGGGSSYDPKSIETNAVEPQTYEEAMEAYEMSLSTDRISRGYARLFCDYMGIVLALLPVFLAVTRSIRDQRAQVSQVIYARKVSSAAVVLSRYFAAVVMIGIPVVLISFMPLFQCIYYGESLGVSVDIFAFVKYFCGWLLPIIAVVTAVGFFVTELTNGPVAILVQGVWWLVSIFFNFHNLVGAVGWNLVPRFNSQQETDVWIAVFPQMVRNRIFYSLLAAVLVAATVGIYQLKRKGVLGNGGKISANRKRVS